MRTRHNIWHFHRPNNRKTNYTEYNSTEFIYFSCSEHSQRTAHTQAQSFGFSFSLVRPSDKVKPKFNTNTLEYNIDASHQISKMYKISMQTYTRRHTHTHGTQHTAHSTQVSQRKIRKMIMQQMMRTESFLCVCHRTRTQIGCVHNVHWMRDDEIQ